MWEKQFFSNWNMWAQCCMHCTMYKNLLHTKVGKEEYKESCVILLHTNSAFNTLETGTYIQTYQSETGTDHCASDRSRRSSSRFRCYRWWRLCDGGPVGSPACPRSRTRRCRKNCCWSDTVSGTVGADR